MISNRKIQMIINSATDMENMKSMLQAEMDPDQDDMLYYNVNTGRIQNVPYNTGTCPLLPMPVEVKSDFQYLVDMGLNKHAQYLHAFDRVWGGVHEVAYISLKRRIVDKVSNPDLLRSEFGLEKGSEFDRGNFLKLFQARCPEMESRHSRMYEFGVFDDHLLEYFEYGVGKGASITLYDGVECDPETLLLGGVRPVVLSDKDIIGTVQGVQWLKWLWDEVIVPILDDRFDTGYPVYWPRVEEDRVVAGERLDW